MFLNVCERDRDRKTEGYTERDCKRKLRNVDSFLHVFFHYVNQGYSESMILQIYHKFLKAGRGKRINP